MDSQAPPSVRRRRSVVRLVLFFGLTLIGVFWAAYLRFAVPPRASIARIDRPTPYANARPGVAFVGDHACARCHRDIAADYSRHPMGRSMATVADDSGPEADAVAQFEAQGLRYSVDRKQKKLIHSIEKRDGQGAVVARGEAEIRFVLGSGTRGKSYLLDRDGALFQSPIGWFAQEGRWDLSPGYATQNPHFDRPIEPACLVCHANRFEPVQGSTNSYRQPIFQGLALGCERCHGPGDLHVRDPIMTDGREGRDLTIVNPRHLEPSLREAVCEQCHLQGAVRVERGGRKLTDFRPGLPLEDFLAVFVKTSRKPDENRAVGHVEQMHASRCYRQSGGELGCISCHDPHRKPEPAQAATFYREKCLVCHDSRGCSLPLNDRKSRTEADSCMVCHMPKSPLSNIVHTAATDHRILRRAGEDRSPAAKPAPDPGGELPITLYHADRFDPTDRPSLDRDRAIALAQAGPNLLGPSTAKAGRLATQWLEAALRKWPADVAAGDALAAVLASQNRHAEALKAARAVLTLEPKRERALDLAMISAAQLRLRDDAVDFGRRLLAVNPVSARYHLSLAQVYSRGDGQRPASKQWGPAIAECQAALALDPFNVDARRLVVVAAVMSGDLAMARAEAKTYLAFDPPDAEPLRRWLESQPTARVGP